MSTFDEKLHKIFEIKKEESYQNALENYKAFNGSNREVLEQAIDMFEMLSGYKDSEDILRRYYKEYWELDI